MSKSFSKVTLRSLDAPVNKFGFPKSGPVLFKVEFKNGTSYLFSAFENHTAKVII